MNTPKYNVRIEKISLNNFKNIKSGSLYFNEYKKLERKTIDNINFSSVLGIYGQNGSGKTAVIDALYIIRHLFIGGGLNCFAENSIKKGEKNSTISVCFLLSNDQVKYLVDYSITIALSSINVYVEKETLQYSKSNEDLTKFEEKKNIYSYNEYRGLKNSFLDLVSSKSNKTILSYISSRKTSTLLSSVTNSMYSPLFNKETIEIVNKEEKLAELNDIVSSLAYFAQNKFLIVTTSLFDGINNRGLCVNGFDYNENQENEHKNISILFGRQTLNKEKYKEYIKMLDASGKVISTFVPGLEIKPHIYNETLDSKGEKFIEFEIMSVRDGYEIPLYYESRGIKQMLTYVGDLIGVFNEEGTFIAIDELDSGVFEYLLGELVYSFDNFAMGQLLFTSHNFRILEKIKSNEIFFATTNNSKKFVQPKYIKNNNNLRDIYYRLITQGDKDDKFYNKASSEDIIKTFSSLWRKNK